MAPEEQNHRIALIRTAARLFQCQGYSATGVSQIIRESKTPRGSFYYYFPDGKKQLAEETVRRTGAEISVLLEEVFTNAPNFSAGVDTVTQTIGNWFADSEYAVGCPITAVHLEQTPKNAQLSKVCHQVFDDWVEIVQNHTGLDPMSDHSRELAQGLILAVEGAWILARAKKDTEPFHVAAKMIKGMI